MVVVQLMASPFFGGPERQMVGLARSLPDDVRTVFLTFEEQGRCRALLSELNKRGLQGESLEKNYPDVPGAVRELARKLRELRADVLCCNGYKPDIIGLLAARQVGVPVVSISHGWTRVTWKVRLNEALDRLVLGWMDAVVCVSEAQAVKVRRAGVPPQRVLVIRNAIGTEEISEFDRAFRGQLEGAFCHRPRWIVGAAGRLSPEKGMDQLVQAANAVLARIPDVGFVVFGDGSQRKQLEDQIHGFGLQGKFVLAGFRSDLGRLWPCLDVAVLPSWTEGMPVMVLEAMAAGVPVVATAVGGTPEVVDDGNNGYLVPPGSPIALADRIRDLLEDEVVRRAMGLAGQEKIRRDFTFTRQAEAYRNLFERLVCKAGFAGQEKVAPDGGNNGFGNQALGHRSRGLAAL